MSGATAVQRRQQRMHQFWNVAYRGGIGSLRMGECDMACYLPHQCTSPSTPLLSLAHPSPSPKCPVSTVVLSRVCVNYLSSRATFSDWMICPEHQRLLLDSWKPGNSCCHHEHREAEETEKPLAAVSFAMSRDILRRDGMVLPIGGAVCQPCRQRYIQQHIPGLNSIHAISKPSTPPTSSLPPSTPPRPALSLSRSSSSGPLSPEEIKRKISSLQPLQVISSPASSGRQKFFVLQPNQEGPVETVVFEDTSKDKEELVARSAGEEREDSPISDCGSITVKEERIMVDDPELEEENKTKKEKKKKKADTSTRNIADTQASTERESEPVETSEMENEQAQGAKSPSSTNSTGTKDDEGTEADKTRETVEAGLRKSEEYRFFCKLCHIGFLKETSYKYHFANNIELHKKMKRTTGKERKCDDCGKSFASDKLFRKHMYNEHKLDDPFFCKICNIVLKNESAYKSHHSKLHLERRTKICYCRECEEIFTCKVEHQEHILTHWEELGDEEGFQCSTCGKVFGSGNQSAYVKHLATHDDEVQKACDCPTCLEDDGKKGKKRKAPPLKPINKKLRSDVLEATTKTFGETEESEENNVDNPDEVTEEDEGIAEVNGESDDEEPVTEASKFSVNCGVCGNSFKDIDKLESHIASAHGRENEKKQFPFTAREGGWECHLCHSVLRTSRELKSHKANRDCSMLKEAGSVREEAMSATVGNKVTSSVDSNSTVSASSSATTPSTTVVRTSVTALWQQSESRNWAAQFGYGKAKPKDKTNEDDTKEVFKYKEPKTNSARKKEKKKKEGKTVKAGDILSAMKMKFGGGDEVDDEEEIEGDDSFLYGSKRVESRRTETQGEPRVLSAASRQTRKRLELLTKQAQSLMKQREKQKAEKLKKKQTETVAAPTANVAEAAPAQPEKSPDKESRTTANMEAVSNNNAEEVQEVSDDDLDLQADINNEDDLLIPLTNGWVCEKRRDITVRGGYVTHYWSPEGDHFKSREEIQQHVDKNQLSVDMAGFDAADINVRETEKQGKQHAAAKMTSVRVKDEETGLPMVIIFPGGRDCLTMDVTATA